MISQDLKKGFGESVLSYNAWIVSPLSFYSFSVTQETLKTEEPLG